MHSTIFLVHNDHKITIQIRQKIICSFPFDRLVLYTVKMTSMVHVGVETNQRQCREYGQTSSNN